MRFVYRPDIDGLRAFAIIAVVGFHFFPEFLPGGFVGVDIFFVISGFLIAGIMRKDLETQTFSFKDFYARRVRRLFPGILLIFGLSVVYGWFILFPHEFQEMGRMIFFGALSLENFALFRDFGYFAAPAKVKPFLHLWSLSIEEQFYLFFRLAWCCFLRMSFSWDPYNGNGSFFCA